MATGRGGPGAAPERDRSIDVLVVDDSAVVREVMRAVLTRTPGIRVTTAADPVIARAKMRTTRPDVIVLDLEMPRMDGLTFLHQLMMETPVPVIVCSGLAGDGTEAAVRALEAGAVEVIAKPSLNVRGFIEDASRELVMKVRSAAAAQVRARPLVATSPHDPQRARPALPLAITTDKLVVIGASTGGTEALRELLVAMPPDAPALVIVQHMPAGFTAAFAKRLGELSRVAVKEAEDNDRVLQGRALIAPGNRHVEIARSGAHYVARLSDGPLVSGHRPSVDVLFNSAAASAGRNAVGVLMTGMGSDGAAGLLAMRAGGAFTMAQDEKTCVVFGMPKEAIARAAAMRVVPLPLIPSAILNAIRGG